jgi:hypothetical protein
MGALCINRHEKYDKNYGQSVSYNIMQLRETNVCNSASMAMNPTSHSHQLEINHQVDTPHTILEEDVQSDTTCSQSAGHCLIGFVMCNAGRLP